MLHTTKPADYIPAEKLADPSNCPDCGARFFYQSASSTLGTIASTARCTKASSGHVLILLPLIWSSSVHGKVLRTPPRRAGLDRAGCRGF